ncbi:TFIIB-type zinc ribbon-containing protein [uncultured Methanobrevibacter sp.]
MQKLFYYKCGECEKSPFVYDENKGELFCLSCGLIIAEIILYLVL